MNVILAKLSVYYVVSSKFPFGKITLSWKVLETRLGGQD